MTRKLKVVKRGDKFVIEGLELFVVVFVHAEQTLHMDFLCII